MFFLNLNNIITYQLNLKENYTPFNIPAIKNTDIFTWALFKKNSEKYITIDYNKNEIIECIFKSGIVRMHAKNINYNLIFFSSFFVICIIL